VEDAAVKAAVFSMKMPTDWFPKNDSGRQGCWLAETDRDGFLKLSDNIMNFA
jgi:hypothetical protein